jgi:hypothetical protein
VDGQFIWAAERRLWGYDRKLSRRFSFWGDRAEWDFENQKHVGFSAVVWLKSHEPFRVDEGLYPIPHLIAYRTDSFSGQTPRVAERPVVPT